MVYFQELLQVCWEEEVLLDILYIKKWKPLHHIDEVAVLCLED